MTHAPRHMAQRSKRVSFSADMTVRKAVSAGMTVAIPTVGAVVAAAPSMAAPDASTSATPLPTAATPTVSAHKVVMFGSRGADVQTVQQAVGVGEDGVFGPLTLAAVKAYQKAHGLVADGIVGPLTWAVAGGTAATPVTTAPVTPTPATAVTTPAAPATSTPAVTTPASTPATPAIVAPRTVWVGTAGDAVKVLQSKLNVSITGVFAADLQTAVKSYQSAQGLVADGVVGPLTWGKLGVSASDVTTLAPSLNVVVPAKPAVTTPAATPVTSAPTAPVVTVSTPTTSTPQAASASAQQIIDYAKTFIGVPYYYGGNGPASFDCSGFTSYVFSHFGYTMPRTADAQRAYFTPTTDPQPGDLLFYGTNPAYHVAIYLGNGMMIDDNHPGGSVGIRAVYGTPSGYARVINH